MKKPNENPEGLKSLLLRFRRFNLAMLTIAVIVALVIPILFFFREPIEWLLDPSKNCLGCHKPESAEYVHEPHKKGKCISCHTPHIKGRKAN
jgi:hypothetical protein